MPDDAPPRIGYVLKMYPRFSETFVVTEILALQDQGADLDIFSLRPPTDGRFHEALSRVQAAVTYLPTPGKPPEIWATLSGARELHGERFDACLEELRRGLAIELHVGTPSDFSAHDVLDSYTEPDGTLYLTMSWRR